MTVADTYELDNPRRVRMVSWRVPYVLDGTVYNTPRQKIGGWCLKEARSRQAERLEATHRPWTWLWEDDLLCWPFDLRDRGSMCTVQRRYTIPVPDQEDRTFLWEGTLFDNVLWWLHFEWQLDRSRGVSEPEQRMYRYDEELLIRQTAGWGRDKGAAEDLHRWLQTREGKLVQKRGWYVRDRTW